MLVGAAGVAAATVAGGLALTRISNAQELPPVPEDSTKVPGQPATETSRGRSAFEPQKRSPGARYAGVLQTSSTDHSRLTGIVTPSDLHFERHHSGVPLLDPKRYKLLIHGLVEKPMVFTLDDLKRYPRVNAFYFVECSGDSSAHWRGVGADATIVQTHPIFSNSEWVGVPLNTLFREVGAKKEAMWFLAESYDGAVMTRSVPMHKGYEDALIAYGQNGEAVRPEQGYPARLLLPGWEGNINVKWLRRIEVSDRPFHTREETSKYTDLLPREGKARQFTFEWDAKSVITYPSGGQTVAGKGFIEITGIAWSGRGKVARVEVSTDGGRSWGLARLQGPVAAMAATRFYYPWLWDGQEAVILSRCTDEVGYIQPTRNQLLQARGESVYHFNGIQAWKVQPDGKVVHVYHEPPPAGFAAALPSQLAGPWPFNPDCGLVEV
ncbi:MAG: sulfite dehydrogenase [Chloroflexi bacterium]|nr:sulfite dehydrogenase [Chloroflexota bacterium]